MFTLHDHIYSNIALPNNFVDKDLESKIQDDLRLDKECYPETKVESFVLKALVRDQPLLFPALVAYEITFS